MKETINIWELQVHKQLLISLGSSDNVMQLTEWTLDKVAGSYKHS